MKKNYLLTILVIILFSTFTCAQSDWIEYNDKEHNFKINFKQKPVTSIDSSVFNDYPLNTYYWEVEPEDSTHENSYYSISLVSYPSDFIHSDSAFNVVEGFINSTQNSILEDETFSLLSSSLLEKNGYPGKSFKWKNDSNGIFFEYEVYLIENKLFQLSVVSREGKNHNIFIEQFFKSFELINIKKGSFSIPDISNERTYYIEFPENPTVENRIVDSEHGKLSLEIQSYEPKGNNDNMVYVALETKYPIKVIDQDDTYSLNTFYKNSIDGSLNSVSGQLISINDIYYNGKLGKEFRCYFSEGKALMVYRLFYINESFYTYGIITLPNKDKNKAMNKFFGSFKIIKK